MIRKVRPMITIKWSFRLILAHGRDFFKAMKFRSLWTDVLGSITGKYMIPIEGLFLLPILQGLASDLLCGY